MPLDFYDVVRERHSVRRFKTEVEVKDEIAKRLIETYQVEENDVFNR